MGASVLFEEYFKIICHFWGKKKDVKDFKVWRIYVKVSSEVDLQVFQIPTLFVLPIISVFL